MKSSRCRQHCQADLSASPPHRIERRQVVDVPEPRLQITEYQGEWKWCPDCQASTCPVWPLGVNACVQYGPRVGAMAVYLMTQQLVPWGRTCEVLTDLVGVEMSEGTLAGLIQRTASQLIPVEEHIKTALSTAKVIHQDETGLYVKNRRNWMHATSTPQLTHYFVHPSRGHEALDEIGILATFKGVSVHRALCNIQNKDWLLRGQKKSGTFLLQALYALCYAATRAGFSCSSRRPGDKPSRKRVSRSFSLLV